MPNNSFTSLLHAELMRRCKKNPRYSVRAFAKQLEIDHSTLSQILRGKRAVSTKTVAKLGKKLGVDDTTLRALTRTRADAIDPTTHIANDATIIAAEALHHALLKLVPTDGFVPDARVIARVLGARVDEVNEIVQRLIRFGLLSMASKKEWRVEYEIGSLDQFNALVWRIAARRIAARADNPSTEAPAPHHASLREFQIIARDPSSMASFHARLFGWRVDDNNALGYRRFIGADGPVGGVWPSPPEGHALVQVFIAVDDVDATFQRALSLGASVIAPPQRLPDGDTLAILLGPEGVPFGVCSRAAAN